MDSNKKTFNFSILFIVVYGILVLLALIWIWFPKNKKQSNVALKYDVIDSNQKAIDIYTVKLKILLSKGNLEELYSRLDLNYVMENNITKDNYQDFLEQRGYISDKINIISSTVNVQENDTYVYRFLYSNGVKKNNYVNVIETEPYKYTLSFEQEEIPNISKTNGQNTGNLEVSESSSDKVTIIDDIKYSVSKKTIRENGITYLLRITNNGDEEVRYKFDNVTNVSVVLDNGKEAYLGGAVMTSDEDNISPKGWLEKELFFSVRSTDQNRIKCIKIKNVRIGDNKKTIKINV